MEKQFILQNQSVAYTLRKSRRARRVRLSVYRDGSVVLTSPLGGSSRLAERFLQQKLNWVLGKIEFFRRIPRQPIVRYTRRDYLRLRDQALILARERLDFYNAIYGFEYKGVSIKNQKTRWGSCSKKGNLNFNYKILLLPREVADYVIVHELCHLVEFNHSKNFWALVTKTTPNYKKLRAALKRGI